MAEQGPQVPRVPAGLEVPRVTNGVRRAASDGVQDAVDCVWRALRGASWAALLAAVRRSNTQYSTETEDEIIGPPVRSAWPRTTRRAPPTTGRMNSVYIQGRVTEFGTPQPEPPDYFLTIWILGRTRLAGSFGSTRSRMSSFIP